MRNAILISAMIILALTRLALSDPDPRKKIFILDTIVHPELKVLSRDIQARIRQEIPRNILEIRELEFEDITVYSDIEKWNPADVFDIRKRKEIENILSERNFRKMLLFSLSPVPKQSAGSRLLLTGRLYDLIKFHCLGPETKQENIKPGTTPTPNKLVEQCADVKADGTDKVMTEASVDLASFDDLPGGLRRLFSMLFGIPQIVDDQQSNEHLSPFSRTRINFGLSARSFGSQNKLWLSDSLQTGDSKSRWLTSEEWTEELDRENMIPTSLLNKKTDRILPRGTFALAGTVYTFDYSENIEKICHSPESITNQLIEVGSSGMLRYGSIRSQKPLLISPDGMMISNEKGMHGFGSFVFVPPPVENYYLLRIILSAKETQQSDQVLISSYPFYKCFHVREPKLMIGFGLGTRFVVGRSISMPVSTTNEVPGYYLELSILRSFAVSGTQYFLPAVRVGGILTGSSSSGQAKVFADVFSTSIDTKYIDLSIRFEPEIIRFQGFGIALISGIGFGAMYVHREHLDQSGNQIGSDSQSWHPIFATEFGLSWSANLPGMRISIHGGYHFHRLLTALEPLSSGLIDWGMDTHSGQFGVTFAYIVNQRSH